LPEPLAPLTPVVVTRFSFVGNSGWQIPEAEREAILFDHARLQSRLWLFEHVTLASLLAQSDQGFHHYILTSDRLPSWAMDHLSRLCQQKYPQGRFTIDPQPTGNARKFLKQFLTDRFGLGPAVQVVLDDDDGLACDFMATLAVRLAAAGPRIGPDQPPWFLSFAAGYALVFDEPLSGLTAQVFPNHFPFINLGLTMVASTQGPNILAIHHRKTPQSAGFASEKTPRMFVRSVHGSNDSRVALNERWKRLDAGLQSPQLQARFGFLAGLARQDLASIVNLGA